jgi:hypothetical protein
MMGELKYFLGFQIKQLQEGTFICQTKYIQDILKKFGIKNAKPIKTPMGTNGHLDLDTGCNSVDQKVHQLMIRSLFMCFTNGQYRPNIMWARPYLARPLPCRFHSRFFRPGQSPAGAPQSPRCWLAGQGSTTPCQHGRTTTPSNSSFFRSATWRQAASQAGGDVSNTPLLVHNTADSTNLEPLRLVGRSTKRLNTLYSGPEWTV